MEKNKILQSIIEANPALSNITPYKSGGSIASLRSQLEVDQVIKLSSNENPLGSSPAVTKIIKQSINELSRYPDDTASELCSKIAINNKVTVEQIIFGAGSSEIIELIMRAFLFDDREVLIPKHSFSIYKIFAKAIGVKVREVSPIDWQLNINDIVHSINDKTNMLIIANPNNPTGSWLSFDKMSEMLSKLPNNIIVVIDEAYFEYMQVSGYQSSVNLIDNHPNLIVTRTFSKIYGLAALRIGYCIASPVIASTIRKLKKPFNVSSVATAAATVALTDNFYITRSLKNNEIGLKQLTTAFKDLGISFLNSNTNFISFNTGSHTQAVYNSLLHKGIITRTLYEYDMPGYLRVSVGLPSENKQFIKALHGIYRHKLYKTA